MIVYRSGLAFRIDASGAKGESAKERFAEARSELGAGRGVATSIHMAALDYRRWWAQEQPEARWADWHASGAYAIDVSQAYWQEQCFLMTFELADDASRFALRFLGLDQAGCDAVVASSDHKEFDQANRGREPRTSP